MFTVSMLFVVDLLENTGLRDIMHIVLNAGNFLNAVRTGGLHMWGGRIVEGMGEGAREYTCGGREWGKDRGNTHEGGEWGRDRGNTHGGGGEWGIEGMEEGLRREWGVGCVWDSEEDGGGGEAMSMAAYN